MGCELPLTALTRSRTYLVVREDRRTKKGPFCNDVKEKLMWNDPHYLLSESTRITSYSYLREGEGNGCFHWKLFSRIQWQLPPYSLKNYQIIDNDFYHKKDVYHSTLNRSLVNIAYWYATSCYIWKSVATFSSFVSYKTKRFPGYPHVLHTMKKEPLVTVSSQCWIESTRMKPSLQSIL